jgi:hypothetical protein
MTGPCANPLRFRGTFHNQQRVHRCTTAHEKSTTGLLFQVKLNELQRMKQ